jgi:hypothetical protein
MLEAAHVKQPRAPKVQLPSDWNFRAFELDHPFTRLVSPLVAARYKGDEDVLGTAFLVAGGVALTATHVILEYLEQKQGLRIEGSRLSAAHTEGVLQFHLRVILHSVNGAKNVFRVRHVTSSNPGDICILRLEPMGPFEWASLGNKPMLRLAPPNLHEEVHVIGFPHSEAIELDDGEVGIGMHPRESIGIVEEVHELKRDSIFLDYPCFRMSAKVLGGMSGAPVTDKNGRICGVAVRSFDIPTNEAPISYAATLWPAARIPIESGDPSSTKTRRLIHLIERGQVSSTDGQRLSGIVDENGKVGVALRPSGDA